MALPSGRPVRCLSLVGCPPPVTTKWYFFRAPSSFKVLVSPFSWWVIITGGFCGPHQDVLTSVTSHWLQHCHVTTLTKGFWETQSSHVADRKRMRLGGRSLMVSLLNLFSQYSFSIYLFIQYFNIYSFNIYWAAILCQAFLHLHLIKVMALPFSRVFGDHLWDSFENLIAHPIFSARVVILLFPCV